MYVCRKLLREVCVAGAIKTEYNISTKGIKNQRAEDYIEEFVGKKMHGQEIHREIPEKSVKRNLGIGYPEVKVETVAVLCAVQEQALGICVS